jgi:dihydroorotase
VAVGHTANLVVFDAKAAWTVDPTEFQSKSRNTPFEGRNLTGKVVHTFYRGRPTVLGGSLATEALV